MKIIIKSVSILLAVLCTMNVFATDLLDAYWDATRNDPTFRAAKSQLLADEEVLSQAHSALWPIIDGNASRNVLNETRVRNTNATGSTITRARNKSHSLTINLTQPLFNYETWARIKQAHARVRQAIAAYKASEQDVMLRVAIAYFNVLEAQDTLSFTMSEKRANSRQLEQARQRYKVGLDAITSVYDAQAAFDAVVSREITARNNLRNRLEDLGVITGKSYAGLVSVRHNLPLRRPQPIEVSQWVKNALKYNFNLIAARAAVDVARDEINISKGAMIPTLNLVASYSNVEGNNFGFGTNDTESGQVGLAVNVPVLQGTNLISIARQNGYNFNVAVAGLDRAAKETTSAVRQAYNSIISGIGAVRADRQAVRSSTSSLESTEAAFKVGTRTMVDVLDKQRDLFDAQRQLSADQYEYIRQIIRLKLASGLLNVADLEEVNSWLRGPTAHTTTERFKAGVWVPPAQPLSHKRIFLTDPKGYGVEKPYLLHVRRTTMPMQLGKRLAPNTQHAYQHKASERHHSKTVAAMSLKRRAPVRHLHTATKPNNVFYLQLGTFEKASNASRLQHIAKQQTHSTVRIQKHEDSNHSLFAVTVGPVVGRNKADLILTRLEKAGVKNILIKHA